MTECTCKVCAARRWTDEFNAREILEPLERVTFWLCDGVAYEMTHPGVLEDWNSLVQRSRGVRNAIATWRDEPPPEDRP